MEQREIKFMAWDGEIMIYLKPAGLQYFDFEGNYVLAFAVDGYDGFWAHEQYDSASKKASKFPIMRFTGLLDKVEVDIYESDIVECDYGRGEVVWMLGAWMVRWIDDKEAQMEFLGLNNKMRRAREDGEQFKVIGNRFSTPELLTQ